MPTVNTKKSQTGGNGGSSTFNLDSFGQQLEEQRAVIEARQQAEYATEVRQNEIMQRSNRAAQQYDREMDPVRKDLMNRRAKAEHARQLADSGSVFDTLRLMGLQQSDPGGYKRDVRMKRTAEDIQYASAVGGMHSVTQDALKLELISSAGKLNELKVLESIGAERLKQLQEEATILRGNLEANEVFQSAAIQKLTPDELRAAAAGAKTTGGETNINGITVSQRNLEDRLEALTNREYEIKRNAYIRQAGEIEMVNNTAGKEAELNARKTQESLDSWQTDAAIRQADRILGLDAANRLPTAIRTRDAEQRIQDDKNANVDFSLDMMAADRNRERLKVLREGQQKILDTYNYEELNALANSGFKNESEQFTAEDVMAAIARKQELRQSRINDKVIDMNMQGFDKTAVRQEGERLDIMQQRIKEGTPMADYARRYRGAIGIASVSADSTDPVERLAGYEAFLRAKDAFEKGIDKQALDESNGDKAKEDLLKAYYRGQPIPQETLRTALQDRLVGRKSAADLIPPEVSTQMERRYREGLAELNRLNVGTAAPMDKKTLEAEAAQQAISWAVNQSISGRTESILSSQVRHPGHPLQKRGWTENQMAASIKVADDEAFEQWISQSGLTREEGAAVRANQEVPERNGEELRAQLRFLENSNLIESFNGIDPDLGRQVADWWQNYGEEYLRQESAAYDANMRSGTFAQVGLRSLASEQELNSMRGYAAGLVDSEGTSRAEEANNRASFLAFGGDPEKSQVMALHFNKDLEDSEKEQVWEGAILPLVNESYRRGFSYQEANRWIEKQLMVLEPKDKELNRLVKILKKGRAVNVEQTFDYLQIANSFDRSRRLGVDVDKRGQQPTANIGKNKVDWYYRVKARQPQVPTGE